MCCHLAAMVSGCLVDGAPRIEGPITDIPTPAGTYVFSALTPVEPPFGDIDPEFLDGRVPDAVSYDVMGGLLWRYVVLEKGEISLGEEGDFTFRVQFDAYETSPGRDVGPYQSCSRLIGGSYAWRGSLFVLSGIDSRETDRIVYASSADTLKIADLWSSCELLVNGTGITSEYHMRNVILVRQRRE